MNIRLDSISEVPPYAQVRTQIQEQVLSGQLPPGTRLPSVRQLASDLGLAANTVARAYRELEQTGVLVTRGRNGTVVPDTAAAELTSQQERLCQAARTYLTVTDELRVGLSEALDAVRRAANLRG